MANPIPKKAPKFRLRKTIAPVSARAKQVDPDLAFAITQMQDALADLVAQLNAAWETVI